MCDAVLYIAISLDGFIADKDGGVDWLKGESDSYQGDTGYENFYETVGAVIMGYHTYHQIVTELSPTQWVYSEKITYVLTHKPNLTSTDRIRFVNEPLECLIQRLKQKISQDIWICGGADIAQQCLEKDLIDKLHLTTIPVILGKGIRLFGELEKPFLVSLVSLTSNNGMVDCVYRRRQE